MSVNLETIYPMDILGQSSKLSFQHAPQVPLGQAHTLLYNVYQTNIYQNLGYKQNILKNTLKNKLI